MSQNLVGLDNDTTNPQSLLETPLTNFGANQGYY